MPATEYLLTELVRAKRLTPAEADRVRAWATRSGAPSATEALVQAGVLDRASARTLALMQKGFITATDAVLVLRPEQLERLRTGNLPGLASATATATATKVTETARPPARNGLAETSKAQADETSPGAPALPQKPAAIPKTERVFANAEQSMRAERPSAATITVGATLGKCLLTGVIGRGGRGVVYSALHTTLNIPVAVKVITADDRECAELLSELRHEAQLLARLNHPNVVRVLDFDHSGLPYVVMEMVEGSSLADLIVQTGGLRPERAADVVLQAAHGLSAAWELGIVHRDIKPANLLLTRDGTVRIADLGLALTAGAADGDAGAPLGTCAYMAPEQARSAATVDFRADLYALGATLFHAVTGRLPFEAKSAREMLLKHATQTAPAAHEVAPGLVPPALSALIAKMLAKDPAERHRSYAELIGDLRAFLNGGHAPTKGAPTQVAPVARPTTIMGWLFRKKEHPEARDE